MILLPIEIYLILLVVVPLGVCFAKWKNSGTWTGSTLICAGLSWVYFNLWMMVLAPPENGFTSAVYFFTGWLWMLPVFAVVLLPFRILESRLAADRISEIGSHGFLLCAWISGLVLIWNFFGWMSESRAIIQARQELQKRGLEPRGAQIPVYENGHWIVRYPDCAFGEICLTRNGRMRWIGGPD